MKSLHFEIVIDTPVTQVWDMMLSKEGYEKWAGVAWPGSTFEGEWKEGTEMKFVSPTGEGTLAKIEKLVPYNAIEAIHIAVLLKEGKQDRESDMAKNWIGATECYYFHEVPEGTQIMVRMKIYEAWAKMMEDTWPKALQALKEMVEGKQL